ncbi:YitT family protein [Vagococcus sp. BWB3-3]|uniref:YitT family protein n=1 Tax=Vagococcus allomyrinae TaxID=2794353 RepID=A0A940SRA7_9ENTE|nr:YitT family protein [Vagococcus allomyrinae]MBP1040602.1 YitT family protein [Vagococcus allomyrinae]
MKQLTRIKDLLLIFMGTSLYAFGLVAFNLQNNLAEGGITGVTLILKALLNINPAYSTLLINIPLILLGGKVLGSRTFFYTIWGTIALSLNLWFWQRVPLTITVDNDLLIAALLAGLAGGIGSGLVYRVGGTTGGTDIIARILEKRSGLTMGKSLLLFDVIVLLLSLVYIDIVHMMYTLIAAFVFSRVVDFVQEGTYSAKGLIIVSDHHQAIARQLMNQMERGVTYLKGEGAYSAAGKTIIYCVVSSREIAEIKFLVEELDSAAFVSIINVHEVLGEGFSFGDPPAPRKKTPALNLKPQKD